ncbi:hypothetical protein M3P05_14425 [Sansalvadorimonas sp. 2012CJ34-2]|uniref:Uncharacterized protein n=1 Tax=Parendozoicomonas callyspongiae TaxID=2942213 RepID=A0ABT0PIG1_9GAMM|nr:hypothetical protein [Sansalvadorimonas sp. 2012CJ34-2]MCL6271118.1 hypothetical protein [Sansalvadorimonas sp. 2012CJ34-2]
MNRRFFSQAFAFILMALLLMNSITAQADTGTGSIRIVDVASPGNRTYEAKTTFQAEEDTPPTSFESLLRLSLPTEDGQMKTSVFTFAGKTLLDGVEYTLTPQPNSEDEEPVKAGIQFQSTSLKKSTRKSRKARAASGEPEHEYVLQWLTEDNSYANDDEVSVIKASHPLTLCSLESTEEEAKNQSVDLGSVITLLVTKLHSSDSTEEALKQGAEKIGFFTLPDKNKLVLEKATVYDPKNKAISTDTHHLPTHLLKAKKTVERVYLVPTEKQLDEDHSLRFVTDPDIPELIRSLPFLLSDHSVFVQIKQTASSELVFELIPYFHGSLAEAAANVSRSSDMYAFIKLDTVNLVINHEDGTERTATSSLSTKIPDMSDPKTVFTNMLERIDLIAALTCLAYQVKNKGKEQTAPSSQTMIRQTPEQASKHDNGWISESAHELDPDFSFPAPSTQRTLLRYSRTRDRLHMLLAKLSPGAPKTFGAFLLGDNVWHIMDYRIVSSYEYEVSLYPFQHDPAKELAAELKEHLLNRIASGMVLAERQLNIEISPYNDLIVTLKELGKSPFVYNEKVDNLERDSVFVDPATLKALPDQHEFVPSLMAALEVLAEPDQLKHMPLNTLITSYQTLKANRPWFGETSQFFTDKARNNTLVPHRKGKFGRETRRLIRAAFHPATVTVLGLASGGMGVGAYAGGIPFIPLADSTLMGGAIVTALSPFGKLAYEYPKTLLAGLVIGGTATAAFQHYSARANELPNNSTTTQPPANQTSVADSSSTPSSSDIQWKCGSHLRIPEGQNPDHDCLSSSNVQPPNSASPVVGDEVPPSSTPDLHPGGKADGTGKVNNS